MASISSQDLLDQALQLSEDERTELVSALLASLDGPPDLGADEAWAAELTRRARAVRDGTAQVEPWPTVRERLLRRFQK